MRDAGLQAERTALAWSRTALAVLVNALLLLRAGLAGQGWHLTAIGLALLVAAGVTQAFAHARRRLLTHTPAAAPATVLVGITCLTSVCGFGALLAIAVATST